MLRESNVILGVSSDDVLEKTMDIFLAQMISMLSMVILIELSVLMMVVLPFCGTDIGWAESFTFFFYQSVCFLVLENSNLLSSPWSLFKTEFSTSPKP